MKSFFKKSAISLFIVGMAGASYASMPSHNTNTMWSPHFTGWFIGVDGLDLRAQNGDLDYVTVFPANSTQPYYTQSVSTDRQWNWRLYGGIKFTENDDLTLSWQRMRQDDKSSAGIASTESFPRFFTEEDWTGVSGKVNFDLDEVYGVWGHTINFNNPWSVRFAAGLEYARLHSDLTVDAGSYIDDYYGGVTAHSHLKGFGPRVEFDATYHLPYNFALFANTNAALLVSKRNISIDGSIDFDGSIDNVSSDFSTRHVVIPKVGMRLGASYAWMFGQSGGEGGGSASALTIDAGWQVESYIHAIERPDNGYSSSTFATTKSSNFGDEGWFLGLKYSAGWL